MRKTSKILSVLLSIILIVSVCPLGVFEFSAFAETEGIFEYSINNGEAIITGLVDQDTAGDIEIPSTIGGYPVTEIGDYAFAYCYELTSITIPDSVTEIGSWAFEDCTGLTEITIPDSVTEIGDEAFYGCRGLTSVTIGNSVTSIAYSAFYGCTGLTSIAIPGSVESIDSFAFEKCTGLKSVKLSDGVAIIGYKAFNGCTGLTEITIPDSVTEIGDNAFYGTAWYNNQPDGLVYAGKVVYKYKGKNTCPESITIKEGTVSITNYAFFDWNEDECSGLKSIQIPDGVISIGGNAFYYCTGLENISIPDSVAEIGGDAFYNTAWYNNQPDGLVYAGKVVYKYKGTCPENITIKDGTVGIASYAFYVDGDEYEYSMLKSIKIPDSVIAIGNSAFQDCGQLTSITLGKGITFIGDGAFASCDSLIEVYYNGTEQQKNNIYIDNTWCGNENLLNATWHYMSIPPCEHKNTEIRNAKAATCKAEGYTGDTYCSDCGEKLYEGETISKTDHSFAWKTTKLATAEEEGLKEKVCSTCGEKNGESEAIAYKGYMPGDIGGDGAVNNQDLATLFQYLSGWEVTVNQAALDINGDGSVNNQDLATLFQFLSGWAVEIH